MHLYLPPDPDRLQYRQGYLSISTHVGASRHQYLGFFLTYFWEYPGHYHICHDFSFQFPLLFGIHWSARPLREAFHGCPVMGSTHDQTLPCLGGVSQTSQWPVLSVFPYSILRCQVHLVSIKIKRVPFAQCFVTLCPWSKAAWNWDSWTIAYSLSFFCICCLGLSSSCWSQAERQGPPILFSGIASASLTDLHWEHPHTQSCCSHAGQLRPAVSGWGHPSLRGSRVWFLIEVQWELLCFPLYF